MLAQRMSALRLERTLACVCLSATLAAGLLMTGCQSASTTDQAGDLAIQAVPAGHSYAPLPEPLASFGAVASDGWLYVYGGHRVTPHQYHVNAVTPAFRRLNLDSGKQWVRLPDGPPVQGMNLAAADGKIYRVGGMQPRNAKGEKVANYSIDDVASYDPAKGQWQALPSLPEPRSSHDLAIVDGKLYVIGGWNMDAQKGDQWFDHSLVLDLSSRDAKWEKVEQPFVRRALIVAVMGKDIYVLGGMDDADEIGGDVDIYNTATGQWRKGPSIPGRNINGFAPAATVLKGRLYLSVFDGSLYRLNEAGDAWDKVLTATPRIVHRLVTHGDNILIVAGAAGQKSLYADIQVVKVEPNGQVHLDKPAQTSQAAPASVKPVASADAAQRQTVCPVMTGSQIGAKDDVVVQYQGVEVRLCCNGCANKWKRDTDAYLQTAYLPQLAGLDLPQRDIEQTFCPVYKDRVVSSKDPHVEYQGKTIYFYNHSALRKWKADPARYADPNLLPQLAQH